MGAELQEYEGDAKRQCVSLHGDAFLDDGHNGKRREENVAAVKTGTSSAHDARGEALLRDTSLFPRRPWRVGEVMLCYLRIP